MSIHDAPKIEAGSYKSPTPSAPIAVPGVDDHRFRAEIVWRDVDTLTPYARNTKKHPRQQVDKISGSIAEFGFDQPIVVDGHGVIIKGHGRREAAIRLGIKQVPVIVRTDLSDAQIRAARLVDNRSNESEWDLDMLALEIRDLKGAEFDCDLLGFEAKELEAFGDRVEGNEDDGAYTKKIEAPIYEPKGERPPVESLVSFEKTNKLVEEIEASKLPEAEKDFLLAAAARHAVFNYERIAEFYAHASPELQNLMERSALVIIDFEKAIENGFVALSEKIAEAYRHEEP